MYHHPPIVILAIYVQLSELMKKKSIITIGKLVEKGR